MLISSITSRMEVPRPFLLQLCVVYYVPLGVSSSIFRQLHICSVCTLRQVGAGAFEKYLISGILDHDRSDICQLRVHVF